MKKFFLIFFLTACTLAVQASSTTLKIKVLGSIDFTPTVNLGLQQLRIEINPTSGIGELIFPMNTPSIVTINLQPRKSTTVYLASNTVSTIVLDNRTTPMNISFEGDNINENNYLNGRNHYPNAQLGNKKDASLLQIAQFTDSIADANSKTLKKMKFSKDFKKIETQRMKVISAQRFMRECSYKTKGHQDEYISLLRARMPQNAALLSMSEYRDFMESAIRALVNVQGGVQTDAERYIKYITSIEGYIEEPSVRAWLIDTYVTPHISSSGVEGNEFLIELFERNVTDTERLRYFKEVCSTYDEIAKGKICPDFCFNDVNGKPVSLSDLKGKFTYIDVWATWCGPCKEEIPSLEKLEVMFKNDNIQFVSLSIDKNKDIAVWKKMITDKNMGGIQLHLGENWDWIKKFMPVSLTVPRFILLDENGAIISANMTRPSDPTTAKTIQTLLNSDK